MKKLIPVLLVAVMLLTSCGETEQKREINLEAEEEKETVYELVAAEVMDVTEIVTLNVSYAASKTEEYSFNKKNAVIDFVYVERGDKVQKGDVLATIESENIAATIEELKHTLGSQKLNLKQTVENRDFAIETEEYLYLYTERTEEDKEALDKKVESINSQYASSISSLEDQIKVTGLRLSEAEQEYTDSRIVSKVNGVVTFVKANLEGSLVDPEETIIRLYDEAECLFISNEKAKKEYIKPDETYSVVVGMGASQKTYEVRPIRMSEWANELYFEPVNPDEQVNVNEYGKISIVTAEALNVLAIPKRAFHISDDKYYVYYLDEEGIRRMKWVTPGLIGTEYVEIKEGLSKGEFIILK